MLLIPALCHPRRGTSFEDLPPSLRTLFVARYSVRMPLKAAPGSGRSLQSLNKKSRGPRQEATPAGTGTRTESTPAKKLYPEARPRETSADRRVRVARENTEKREVREQRRAAQNEAEKLTTAGVQAAEAAEPAENDELAREEKAGSESSSSSEDEAEGTHESGRGGGGRGEA